LTLLPLAVRFVDRLDQIVERAVAWQGEKARKAAAEPLNVILRQQSNRDNVVTGVHSRRLLNVDNDAKRIWCQVIGLPWQKSMQRR
jgi:hypothetical protein